MELTEAKDLLPTRREIATKIFRHPTVLGATFLLVVLGFIVTGQFKPKYKADMSLLVRKERVDPIVTTSTASTPELQGISVSEEDLNSEAQILRGAGLLHDVVLQSGLVSNPQASPATIEKAVRKLAKSLVISPIEKTNLISITYSSASPVQSERVLNTMETLYPAVQRNFEGDNHQVAFFEQQVKDQQRALDQAQARLVDFTQRTGIISSDMQRDISVHQLEELKQEQIQTDVDIANLQGNISALRSQIGTEPSRVISESKTADNPQLRNSLQTTLLNLQLKKTDLLNKYDPSYRLVQDVNREIETTQQLIKSEEEVPVREETSSISPLRQTLETEYEQDAAQLQGLRKKRGELMEVVGSLQATASNLTGSAPEQTDLLNNVQSAQGQLKLYVEKLAEAKVTQSLNSSNILNVVVAQQPVVPALPENSTLAVFLTMLFAAVVLSAGMALLFDIFDPTIHNASDLGGLLDVPVLAEFGPELRFERGY